MRRQSTYELSGKRVWVAGHNGMVGRALVHCLASEGADLLTVDRKQVDLTRQEAVEGWMAEMRPQAVFVAAAKVGGILANHSYPADFLYDNLMIAAHIIHSARRVGVEKLLFLGSSCIYPKHAAQPVQEAALLTGPLEPTNEWYAIAKIAGVKLCQAYRKQHGCDFISALPTNLFGPYDNFDLQSGHVIPALMRKAHEAKLRGDDRLVVWGSGTPRREFIYSHDCADALVHLMKVYSAREHVNVGSGEDMTIYEIAKLIGEVVGFEGKIVTDPEKPDGTPRKLLDVTLLREQGWSAKTSIRAGLIKTYEWFKAYAAEDAAPETNLHARS